MKKELVVYECGMAKEPSVKVGKELVRMMYGVPVIESRCNAARSNIKTFELVWNAFSFGAEQTSVTKYPHLTYYTIGFLHQDAVMINMTINQESDYTCLKIMYQADGHYIIWKMSLDAYRKLACENSLLPDENALKEMVSGKKRDLLKNVKDVLENYRKGNSATSGLKIIIKNSDSAVI